MNDLSSRGALGLKQRQPPNPRYLEEVRKLPCVICQAFGEQQLSPTSAHHVIHDRFSQRKVPDILSIPLCEGHHQGLFDTSKLAIHKRPSLWRETYGADHEYIEVTQDKLEQFL